MTPDEAKTKQCRAAGQVSAGYTGYPPSMEWSSCVGPSCMHWRWSEEKRTLAFLDEVRQRMAAKKIGFNTAVQDVYANGPKFAHTEGYCGLAGPENG